MNTFLIGLLIVGAFVVWKFGIQPRVNEGKPIKPKEGEKTFGEQMDKQMREAFNPKIDF